MKVYDDFETSGGNDKDPPGQWSTYMYCDVIAQEQLCRIF